MNNKTQQQQGEQQQLTEQPTTPGISATSCFISTRRFFIRKLVVILVVDFLKIFDKF